MLDESRLASEAETYHAVACEQWREIGVADTTLVYLPERGYPTLHILLSNGQPSTEDLARRARELRTAALILTAEAWALTLPNEKIARLPRADRPRPSESADRRSVILTTAVRADGHVLLRQTGLTTGPFGRTLIPGELTDPDQNPDGLAAWLHQALLLAARPST